MAYLTRLGIVLFAMSAFVTMERHKELAQQTDKCTIAGGNHGIDH